MSQVKFESMDNIQRLHKGHWFNPDTMKFFRSIVYTNAIHDVEARCYKFISSEKGPDNQRKYTIRSMDYEGHISTDIFQQFNTKRQAELYLAKKYNLGKFFA